MHAPLAAAVFLHIRGASSRASGCLFSLQLRFHQQQQQALRRGAFVLFLPILSSSPSSRPAVVRRSLPFCIIRRVPMTSKRKPAPCAASSLPSRGGFVPLRVGRCRGGPVDLSPWLPEASGMTVATPIIAILPRAAAHRCHTRACAPRRWEAVYDVVAQMAVLPVVCVSLVGVVGVMFGLECMETLQRRDVRQMRFSWTAIVGVLLRGHRTTTMLAHTSGGGNKREHNSDGGKSVNQDRHQREREDSRRQDTRPLKKQKSSADHTSSSSNDYNGDSDGNASLETQPQTPNEACVRPKKTRALSPRKRRRVLIWDLDETLVLFASLYTGTFAQQHGKEVALGVKLGEQMMTFLLAMLERHFFFNDLHDADIDHIRCLDDPTSHHSEASRAANADAGNGGAPSQSGLMERYERIREIYEREGAVDFLSDERSEWFAIREALVASIDTFSTGWLREARQVLELLTTKKTTVVPSSRDADADEGAVEYENVNLLVTNTQLAPALCKCLIYQLDAFFPIECVYSSSKLHKQHCFEQIVQQYGGEDDKDASSRVEFIAIGDGAEEEHVSRALGIPFHKIRSLADLKRLRFDLQLDASPSSL